MADRLKDIYELTVAVGLALVALVVNPLAVLNVAALARDARRRSEPTGKRT